MIWLLDLGDTIWLFNIAMENGPFIDDFPIKTSIYKGFSHGYVSHNQRVYVAVMSILKAQSKTSKEIQMFVALSKNFLMEVTPIELVI